MIEVIVKFLTTSAGRKASTTTHATTPTKFFNPREGVADMAAREGGGARKTPPSDDPTHTGGLSPSAFEKSKVDQDVDTQMATGKLGSLSTPQHGKPITKSLTTNPTTHDNSRSHPTPSHLSEVSQSTLSHFNKPVYPQSEPTRSPLKESTRHGLTAEPRKHSGSLLQKETAGVVSVKPQGGVQSLLSSRGSGHVISPRPTGTSTSIRSSVGGVLRSSLTTREVPTLKSDSKTESAKQKPQQRKRNSSDNKEVTAMEDEISTNLVANRKFY